MAAPVARLQALECTICLEPYAEDGGDRTPMSLPCGHSLCRKCCSEIWQQSQRLSVRCPFDRIDHLVRDVTSIPRNLTIIAVIAELREQAGEPAPPPAPPQAQAPRSRSSSSSSSSSSYSSSSGSSSSSSTSSSSRDIILNRGLNALNQPIQQPETSAQRENRQNVVLERDPRLRRLHNNNAAEEFRGNERRGRAGEPALPPAPPQAPARAPLPAPARASPYPPHHNISRIRQIRADRRAAQNVMLERDPRLRQLHNNNDAEDIGGNERREQAGQPALYLAPASQHILRVRISPPPFYRPLNAPNQPIQQPPTAAQRENLQNARLDRDPRLRRLHNNNDAEDIGGNERRGQAGQPAPPPAPAPAPQHIPWNWIPRLPPFIPPLNAPNQPISQHHIEQLYLDHLNVLWEREVGRQLPNNRTPRRVVIRNPHGNDVEDRSSGSS